MKIALLGASGFVGTRLVERGVLGGAAQVRPVVRSYASLARLSRFDPDALDYRMADARDEKALTSAFEGCEAVVHAIVGNPDVITGSVAPAYRAACRAKVRRLVFLSSASVHGQAPAEGTDESSPVSARQDIPYNNAKVQAERLLLRERAKGSTEIVILRPSIVWGPRSRWVSDFADAVLQENACITDHGRGICNSIYVDNLLAAVELSLDTPGVDGEAFLVQDDEAVTWRDFYAPILAAFGKSWDDVSEVVPSAPRKQTAVGRVEALGGSRSVQTVVPYVPKRIKRVGRALLKAWPHPAPADIWSLPRPVPPALSQEMARLYQCSWRLPDDKARRMLGYAAALPFEEAMRRSIGWLKFAGYPAHG